ncbi:hypothetical protein [Streptomyces sp. BK79]
MDVVASLPADAHDRTHIYTIDQALLEPLKARRVASSLMPPLR